MKIVVNDANILIDLADLDLLHYFSKLNFELHTNDFVLSEIKIPSQLSKINQLVRGGKMIVATTKSEEYLEITNLQTKNLSFQDCSILYYTKKVSGMLLSGDGNLRKAAKSAGTEVRGIIYIFDQLIEKELISKNLAVTKITQLQANNNRLPKAEIKKRIELWSE